MHTFRCTRCGQEHAGIPMAWGSNWPPALKTIPRTDWRKRVFLTEDDCVIDGSVHLVRGCLDIPIRGTDEVFRWLVWVSVDRRGHHWSTSLWRRLFRLRHPPYPGSLDDSLPYDAPTRGLSVEVRSRGAGRRPIVVVTASDHTLAIEQSGGITIEKAYELAGAMLHALDKSATSPPASPRTPQ